MYDNNGLKCTQCKIFNREFKIISISKNIRKEYLIDFIITIQIDNILSLFTIRSKAYINNNIPTIIQSKLIGISEGDKVMINNNNDKYGYKNINNIDHNIINKKETAKNLKYS